MFRARFGFGGTVKNIVAWLGLSLMVASFVWWQVLSIPRPATSSHRIAAPAPFTLVVLDPGHGGQDSGAMCGAIFEKDLTFDIAQRVDRLLQAHGLATLMTRVGDSYVSLADRAAVTTRAAACFVDSLFSGAGGRVAYFGEPEFGPVHSGSDGGANEGA